MKRMKMITLDEDLIDKLKTKPNASQLINDLLIQFFEKDDIQQMGVEELKKFIAIEKLKEKHKAEIEAIENGQ